MQHVIELPGFIPTPLNRLMNAHWGTAARMKSKDKELISTAAMVHKTPKAEGKRRVSLTIVLPPGKRRYDNDGIWKSLLDSLVNCGALKNDSPVWAECGRVEWARGDKACTFITLEELS